MDRLVYGPVLIRGFGTLIHFVFSIYIGRFLGVQLLGTFYIYYSWLSFISILLCFGLNTLILKNNSKYYHQGLHSLEIKLLTKSIIYILLGGVLFYTFVSLLSNEITTHILINNNLRFLPKLVVLSGVIYALIKIISESFKAKNKVSIGLAIEFVFPLMFLFIIVIINRFFNHKILILELIQFHLVIGLFIMVISSLFLFYRNKNFLKFDLSWLKIKNIRSLLTPIKFWLILLLNNLLSIGPYLILPVYVSESEIGYFSIAHRFVGIAATIMFALSSNFGPQFSKYSSENNLGNLIKKFRLSQKYCLFFCIPLLVLYLLFPIHIIKIYGPDFMPALPLLLIMASGRILISFLGLTESFLNMTGHEKWELLGTGISVILFFFLITIKISNDAVLSITWAFTIALSFKSLFSYIIIFNYSHADQ